MEIETTTALTLTASKASNGTMFLLTRKQFFDVQTLREAANQQKRLSCFTKKITSNKNKLYGN